MKTYRLGIYTPEHTFFDARDVESLVVQTPDGERGVLAGHAPLVAVADVGPLRIRQNGVWRECFVSGGILDVLPERVLLFVQAAEWPEEIDASRAEQARARALARLRSVASRQEYAENRVALARALTRLRVSRH